MLPFKSLDNVNGPSNAGVTYDLEEDVANIFTMIVTVTGDPLPSQGDVDLEGSLDNEHWLTLATVALDNTHGQFAVTSVNNDHRVRYVRANLLLMAGGAYEELTAWIVAG